MLTTSLPKIEVERRDWTRVEPEWVPLCPSGDHPDRVEMRELIARVGRWSRDTDSDVIGGARMPGWVRDAERRIADLSAALSPVPLKGKEPTRLRCSDPATGLTVEMQVRNKLHAIDPLGYSPDGAFEVGLDVYLRGERISTVRAWIDESLVHMARRDWAGTGDVRESVYEIAVAMLDAAKKHLRPARFDGFTYR